MRLVVVGAGIAGLSAAMAAHQRGISEIVVIESAETSGGKIRSLKRDGLILEAGPDAFLRRNPLGMELVDRVGITDSLTAPSASSALLYSKERLHVMPRELAMGVPTDPITPLSATSVPLLSRLRASAGISLGIRGDTATDSLGYLCQRRLGRRFTEMVVDPLIGGINAGSVFGSSMALVAPQLETPLSAGPRRLDLSRLRPKAPGQQKTPPASIFASLSGGLGQLTAAIEQHLRSVGVTFIHSSEVRQIEPHGAAWKLHTFSTDGGMVELDADHVVLAVPSEIASSILTEVSPGVSDQLRLIRYSAVALTILGYQETHNPVSNRISGVLVPAKEGTLTTAISIASSKWPAWAKPGELLLRVSTGRMSDRRHQNLSDEDLSQMVSIEARRILGLANDSDPDFIRVFRWDSALPQFRPHHAKLTDSIRRSLKDDTRGTISVAGSYLYGSGIPATIGSGQRSIADIFA